MKKAPNINSNNEEEILAEPMLFDIKNVSNQNKKVTLFGSVPGYHRRKDPEVLIKNYHPDPEYCYEDLLWSIGFSPIFLGKIHSTIVTGCVSEVHRAMSVITITGCFNNGSHISSHRVHGVISPSQYQSKVFETIFNVADIIEISAATRISFDLPGNSEVSLVIYPLAVNTRSSKVVQQVKNVLQWCAKEYNIVKHKMLNEISDLTDTVAEYQKKNLELREQIAKKDFEEKNSADKNKANLKTAATKKDTKKPVRK